MLARFRVVAIMVIFTTMPAALELHAQPLPQAEQVLLTHPFVFTTPQRLLRLVTDKRPIPIVALAFLQTEVIGDLKSKDTYAAAYSGCILKTYLGRFTYEQHSATKAAAELALYAYLHRLKKSYGSDAVAAEAAEAAKLILLNWAKGGLRNHGNVFTSASEFCDPSGKTDDAVRFDAGLDIGRGMPHWVAAQDLLIALQALSPDEQATLNSFLAKLTELLIDATNMRAKGAHLDCNRYSNQVSVQIAGIAGAARLLGHRSLITDVATVGQRVAIPWTKQVEKTIYEPGDKPLNCYPPDVAPQTFHQIPTVQPGEMADRYRAVNFQTFGYPMFSLTNLMLAEGIFEESGQTAALGTHGKAAIQSALAYYSYYFVHFAGPDAASVPKSVVPAYPGFEQYAGKPISRAGGLTIEGADELLAPFLLGARLYPQDDSLKQVIIHAHAFNSYSIGRRVDSLLLDCMPYVADIASGR